MFKRESLRSLILGIITYFAVSVIFDLFNINNIIAKAIILFAVILTAGFVHMIIRKKK